MTPQLVKFLQVMKPRSAQSKQIWANDLELDLGNKKEEDEPIIRKRTISERKAEETPPAPQSTEPNKDVHASWDAGRLFVRNLPFSMTEEELANVFAAHGKVLEVHISIDRDTKVSKGIGFVRFATAEQAIAVCASVIEYNSCRLILLWMAA